MTDSPRLIAPRLTIAAPGDEHLVTGVLATAFREYPVMRYVVGQDAPDYDAALHTLVGMFVMARVLRGETILKVDQAEGLAGAALMSDPAGPPAPEEFGHIREQVWAKLGAEARGRYEAFGRMWADFPFPVPHLHLNMIGVRPEVRGSGISRLLLDEVHRLAAATPGCRGVSLTTEEPENLSLYQHFGYGVVAHAQLDADVESWGLFRPT